MSKITREKIMEYPEQKKVSNDYITRHRVQSYM